jgi:DNA-binding LytR/AlgR family response regulator
MRPSVDQILAFSGSNRPLNVSRCEGPRVGGRDSSRIESHRHSESVGMQSLRAVRFHAHGSDRHGARGREVAEHMIKLTALVVEDEQASRERLKRLLGKHPTRVEVIGEADNGIVAVDLALQLKPDVLFLDVSLPGFDGFDVLHQVPSETRVIFTTAHEEHAHRAFRANALDYLLKPIDPTQLDEALSRVEQVLAARQNGDIVRLLCRDRDKTYVVDAAEVLFLRAEGGYTHVQTRGKYYLTNEPLSVFEKQLATTFVRVHRNTLVNVSHVSALRHNEGEMTAILSSEHEVPVSRRHSQEFRRRLAYDQ